MNPYSGLGTSDMGVSATGSRKLENNDTRGGAQEFQNSDSELQLSCWQEISGGFPEANSCPDATECKVAEQLFKTF